MFFSVLGDGTSHNLSFLILPGIVHHSESSTMNAQYFAPPMQVEMTSYERQKCIVYVYDQFAKLNEKTFEWMKCAQYFTFNLTHDTETYYGGCTTRVKMISNNNLTIVQINGTTVSDQGYYRQFVGCTLLVTENYFHLKVREK